MLLRRLYRRIRRFVTAFLKSKGPDKLFVFLVASAYFAVIGCACYLGYAGFRKFAAYSALRIADRCLYNGNYETADKVMDLFYIWEYDQYNNNLWILDYYSAALQSEEDGKFESAERSIQSAEERMRYRRMSDEPEIVLGGEYLERFQENKARITAESEEYQAQVPQREHEEELQRMDEYLKQDELPGRDATPEELLDNGALQLKDCNVTVQDEEYSCSVYMLDAPGARRYFFFYSDDELLYILQYELRYTKSVRAFRGRLLSEVQANPDVWGWKAEKARKRVDISFLDGEVPVDLYVQDHWKIYVYNGIIISAYNEDELYSRFETAAEGDKDNSAHTSSGRISIQDIYSNPEDFYEDYYDDFWDYEEAEDYYYSH